MEPARHGVRKGARRTIAVAVLAAIACLAAPPLAPATLGATPGARTASSCVTRPGSGRPVQTPGGHRARIGSAPCPSPRATTRHAPRPGRRPTVAGRVGATAIDATDRAAVLAAYQDLLDAEAIPSGWTGSVTGCHPGTVSSAFTDATLDAVNIFRALAGLPPVVFTSALNTRAQAAALIMQAKGALTHSPTESDPCWTALGESGAGSSNLCLGCTGATAVDVYMEDPGANNAAVGHRRWILYPLQTTMGSGSTANANALVVLDTDTWSAPSASPPWIAWPPDGYLPAALVPARLSLSRDGADFTHATATVTLDGQAVTSTIVARNGPYGDPTIVIQVDRASLGLDDPGPDRAVHVTVDGIVVGSQTVSHDWTFRSISGDTVAPTITIGSPVHHAVHQQGATVLADYACDDGAGSGVASCTGPVDDGDPIDTDTLGFHLFTVQATDQKGNVRSLSHRYEVVGPPRPDAMVGGRTGPWTGDGIYAATATPGQTLLAPIAKGATKTFRVRLQNDGANTAAFKVRGKATGATGYTVRYLAAGKDVTAAVRAGSHAIPSLKAGAAVILTVSITATKRSRPRSTLLVDVSLTSVATPAVRDTARASVHRP